MVLVKYMRRGSRLFPNRVCDLHSQGLLTRFIILGVTSVLWSRLIPNQTVFGGS